MSPVRREWLIHGCMDLSTHAASRPVSKMVQQSISQMYGGVEFSTRSWPQRDYRHTLWWYESSLLVPSSVAAYFLKVDNWRGPNLYAGVTVEKGYEDVAIARTRARETRQAIEWWLLDRHWDWHRFVSSRSRAKSLILPVGERLHSELYLWLEIGDRRSEAKYYVVKQGSLYSRGGFKAIEWDDLFSLATRRRPQSWVSVFVARAFSLEECTPELDDGRLIEVFEAMQPVRDLWRQG